MSDAGPDSGAGAGVADLFDSAGLVLDGHSLVWVRGVDGDADDRCLSIDLDSDRILNDPGSRIGPG